jgi:tetratricopeptide (TPR) repeat protein
MLPLARSLRRPLGLAAVVAGLCAWPKVASASSASELVQIAKAHEQAHDEDIALRRYTEALALDPTCGEAYLALGSLRARRGDLRESERVYSVALEHMPSLRAARTARAYVRRALRANASAIDDLLAGAEDDVGALRVIAAWYAEDGQAPAELSVWRRIASRAEETHRVGLLHEAKTMVRALVIVVGTADPAAFPASAPEQGFRRTLSVFARRAAP